MTSATIDTAYCWDTDLDLERSRRKLESNNRRRRGRRSKLSRKRTNRLRDFAIKKESAAFSTDESAEDDGRLCGARTACGPPKTNGRGYPPSRLVPEPEAGSDSEAGVLPESRAALRNRRRRTILLCDSLDPAGKPAPCVDFHSFFPLESGYDRRLKVPAADLAHKPCRAPPELLSGNIQKRFRKPSDLSVRYGAKNWKHLRSGKRRKKTEDGKILSEDESGASGYWSACGTDISFGESEPPAKEGPADRAVEASPRSSQSPKRKSVGGAGAVDSPSKSLPSEPEENLFASLLAEARKNPSVILEGGELSDDAASLKMEDSEAIKGANGSAGNSEGKKAAGQGADKRSLVPQNDEVIEVDGPDVAFEKELRASLGFCGSLGNRDKHGRPSLVKSWPRKDAKDTSAGFGEFEMHTKQFGSRMLEKMGFTGRLGARGQGIAAPVSTQPTGGRQGLGQSSGGLHGDQSNEGGLNEYRSTVAAFSRMGRKAGRKRDHSSVGQATVSNGNEDLFSARQRRKLDRQSEASAKDTGLADAAATVGENLESEFETDNDQDADDFDNGRRAVLVDFDALLEGSRQRRLQAFQAAVIGFEGVPDDVDVTDALTCDELDVGDEEAIRRIFGRIGKDASESLVDGLLARIDAAFEALDVPFPNIGLLSVLKDLSQVCHIGVLHRGSRTRLNRELRVLNSTCAFLSNSAACASGNWHGEPIEESLGLEKKISEVVQRRLKSGNRGGVDSERSPSAIRVSCAFLSNCPKVALEHTDSRPYLSSVKELVFRLGVSASQCTILSSDLGMQTKTSFVVAAHMLGSQSIVSVDKTDPQFPTGGLKGVSDTCSPFDSLGWLCEGVFSGVEKSLLLTTKRIHRRARRRRVLCLYNTQGLWFAARIVYQSPASRTRGRKVLVKYYGWENEEWLPEEDLQGLSRRDFRVLRSLNFQGLMDPEDLFDLR